MLLCTEAEALKTANVLTIQSLSSQLDQDPIFDLSELLGQLADSYPTTREAFAEAARHKPKLPSCEQSNTQDFAADSFEIPFQAKDNVNIRYPLQKGVLNLINSRHHSPRLLDDLAQLGETLDTVDVVALNELIKRGHVLWQFGHAVVLDIGMSVVVKIGASVDVSHAHIVRLIKDQAPNFPIMDILGAVETPHRSYLFMSKAEGVSLDQIWHKLGTEQKTSLQTQLNTIFTELRMIPRPNDQEPLLGSGHPAKCKDMRRNERIATGPIRVEREFNDFLCSAPSRRSSPPWIKMIRSFMREDHRIVLTHGDLTPRNVMVTWDGLGNTIGNNITSSARLIGPETDIRITSVIDWEMSGWYPEYWEFVKALGPIGSRGKISDWCDYLPMSAIGRWPCEFSLDLLLDRWLG